MLLNLMTKIGYICHILLMYRCLIYYIGCYYYYYIVVVSFWLDLQLSSRICRLLGRMSLYSSFLPGSIVCSLLYFLLVVLCIDWGCDLLEFTNTAIVRCGEVPLERWGDIHLDNWDGQTLYCFNP
jgi:hypothetical protein